MPEPDLADTLDLFGGPLTLSRVGGVLPEWASEALFEWVQTVRGTTAELLDANECPLVHMYATNATWTSVRLSPLRNGDMLVTLPAGLLIRLWTAYRLLLSYDLVDDVPMALVGSLEDPSAPDRPTPPHLRPLLRDYTDAATWWDRMEFLDRSVSNRDRDEDAALLMFTSLEIVLSHEIAHILRRHLPIMASFDGVEVARADKGVQVRRALEVDADHIAGFLLGVSRRHLRAEELVASLKVLAFATSGLLALFDPAYLRVFDDFQATDYYHPKVRRGAFFGGLKKIFPEIASSRVNEGLRGGVSWFDKLISRLEVDAFKGRFGQMPTDRAAPIFNPLRSLAFQPTYEKDVDAAERDLAWAQDQYRSRYGEFYVRLTQH